MPLDRRLQILLDEDRHQRVVAIAQERGVSVASIIREAIDRGLPTRSRHRLAAARRLLNAPEMAVPDPGELRAELDELRGRRG